MDRFGRLVVETAQFIRDNALLIMVLVTLGGIIAKLWRKALAPWAPPPGPPPPRLDVEEGLRRFAELTCRIQPVLERRARWWLIEADLVRRAVCGTMSDLLDQVDRGAFPGRARLRWRSFVLLLNHIDNQMLEDHVRACREGREVSLPLPPEARTGSLTDVIRCLRPDQRRRMVARLRYGVLAPLVLLLLCLVRLLGRLR